MPTDRPPIGTKIKRARERLRWSQEKLASAVGVSQKTIDNWEHDRSYPRSAIGALEEALGPLTDDTPADTPATDQGRPRFELIDGEGLRTELDEFKAITGRGDEPKGPPGGILNDQEREIWNARTVSAWDRWEVIQFLRSKERERAAAYRAAREEMEAAREQRPDR